MEGVIKETKNFCIGDLVMFKDGSRHTRIGDINLGVEAPGPIEARVLMAEKLVANGYKLNEQ